MKHKRVRLQPSLDQIAVAYLVRFLLWLPADEPGGLLHVGHLHRSPQLKSQRKRLGLPPGSSESQENRHYCDRLNQGQDVSRVPRPDVKSCHNSCGEHCLRYSRCFLECHTGQFQR
jgi:hypothetical protein